MLDLPKDGTVASGFDEALLEDDPALLYEQAPCGYLSTTPDGRITKANATFLTWTGYTAEQLTRLSFADLLTAGGRLFHETHYSPMLRLQGRVRELALDLVVSGGDRLPALVNAVLDRDEHGEPRAIRIAVFDATERREYERELLRAKQRAEESEARARALARTLQQTLIPPLPPRIPGLDVAAAYRPAGDGSVVGGDFYDVFAVGDEWIVVLGDVCGKGAEAAVVTALARYTLRALAVPHASPAAVLHHLNEVVIDHGSGRFCTVVMARLARAGDHWQVTLCTAGHPPPLLVDAAGGVRMLEHYGPLVGVFPGQGYADHELELLPGETLLLYTDGTTEARGEEGFFGEAALLRVTGDLARSGVPLAEGLLEHLLEFQHGLTRDDIALLSLSAPARSV